MFNIGDKIVLGEKQSYYIIKMPGEVKVMVPTSKAEDIGVRNIISKESAAKVFNVLENDSTEMSSNWNKRYRDNMEKMKSGDIYEIADIVRNLSFKQKDKGLSTAEKKMLTNAKQILVSELALTQATTTEQMENVINDKINTSYAEFKPQQQVENKVVKKFIPFEG